MEFGKAILPRETNNFFTRPLNFDRNKLIQWDFIGLKSVQFCRFLGLKSVQFCIFLSNFVVLNQYTSHDLGKHIFVFHPSLHATHQNKFKCLCYL